jgi:hypothetical protein
LCLGAALTVALLTTGCQEMTHPPQTVAELALQQRDHPQDYTTQTVAMCNVQRVLAPGLTAQERTDSLAVLEKLDYSDPETLQALAGALADASAPEPLRRAVLAFLAKKNYPDLVDYVAEALTKTSDPQMRSAILEWITQHSPAAAKLDDIVKLWAADANPRESDEANYRRLVETISNRTWDEALLAALNAPDFKARGSAIELLSARVKPDELRRRVTSLQARTDTVEALKYYIDLVAYLPATRQELIAAFVAYNEQRHRLVDAIELATRWENEYGYHFNIRDFHLLASLSGDPLRKPMSRTLLALDIARSMTRRHEAGTSVLESRRGKPCAFDKQVDALTEADLWNLALLDQMLDTPWVQGRLRIVADNDKADTQTQCGGLISYNHGKADPRLYEPAEKAGDEKFVPTLHMLGDARDCLCLFIGHFDRLCAPDQAGPTDAELAFAKERNLYLLILTRIRNNRLNAAYVTPAGVVVNLDDYPLGGN